MLLHIDCQIAPFYRCLWWVAAFGKMIRFRGNKSQYPPFNHLLIPQSAEVHLLKCFSHNWIAKNSQICHCNHSSKCHSLEIVLGSSNMIVDIEVNWCDVVFLLIMCKQTNQTWVYTQGRIALKFIYCKISNIRCTKSQNLNDSCSCLCPIHWSQVLRREWRCSSSSAGVRRYFHPHDIFTPSTIFSPPHYK